MGQVQTFTVGQIQAFTATQVAALTIQYLTVGQTQHLTPDQIAALTTAQIATFSLPQVQALSNSQIAALTRAQIKALTLTQIGALTLAQQGYFSAKQLHAFTIAQQTAFPPAMQTALENAPMPLSYGDTTILKHKNYGFFLSLTDTSAGSLLYGTLTNPTNNFASMFIEQGSLTSAEFNRFSNVGATILSGDLIQIEPVAAPGNWLFYWYDGGSWSAPLSTPYPRYNGVTIYPNLGIDNSTGGVLLRIYKKDADLGDPINVGDTIYIMNWTNSGKIPAFLSTSNQAWNGGIEVYWEQATQSHMPTVTNIFWQIAACTEQAYLTTDPIGLPGFFSDPTLLQGTWNTPNLYQMDTICDTNLAVLSTNSGIAFSANELGSFSDTSISNLTTTQINNLTLGQIFSFNTAQLASLVSFDWNQYTATGIKALNNSQIQNIPITVLQAMPVAQIPNLTTNQLLFLSSTQLKALTLVQVQAFTTSQQAALTNASINPFSLVTTAQGYSTSTISNLSTQQIQNLSIAQIQAFNNTQLQALTTTQIPNFTTAQLLALTTTQMQALLATQVQALIATQVQSLNTAQMAILLPKFAAAQMTMLTTAQINALTTIQWQALSATLVAGLSIAQLTILSFTQCKALSSQQCQNLSTNQLNAMIYHPVIGSPPTVNYGDALTLQHASYGCFLQSLQNIYIMGSTTRPTDNSATFLIATSDLNYRIAPPSQLGQAVKSGDIIALESLGAQGQSYFGPSYMNLITAYSYPSQAARVSRPCPPYCDVHRQNGYYLDGVSGMVYRIYKLGANVGDTIRQGDGIYLVFSGNIYSMEITSWLGSSNANLSFYDYINPPASKIYKEVFAYAISNIVSSLHNVPTNFPDNYTWIIADLQAAAYQQISGYNSSKPLASGWNGIGIDYALASFAPASTYQF